MRAAEPDPGLHHRMVSARVAVIDEEAHLSEALLNKLHRSWDWLVREHVDKRNCSRQEPRASEHAQPRAAALRACRLRVSLLRGRAQPLGTVEAPDERAAEVAAVQQFQLSDEQRKRLAVREE
jgi:hypothetical protein